MEESLNISDYLSIIKRRKWSIILPILIFMLAAIIAILVIPPKYRASSTILIEEQEIPRDFVASTITGYADQHLQMINQRIMSSARLLEIVNRFNLYEEYRGRWTTEYIIEEMRKATKFQTISADIVDRRTGRPSAATIAFSISFDGQKPAVVQQVVTVLASFYLQENLRAREQQTAGASKFLEDETMDLKKQLAALDANISAFKKQNMDFLPELLQVNIQAIERIERELDQLNDQLRTLREKESYYVTQLASIPPEAASQDKALLRELKARLVQIESRYSDRHPDVIKTRSEIAQLEERLNLKPGEKGSKDVQAAKSAAPIPEQSDNPAYVALVSQLASVKSEIGSVKRLIDNQQKKRDSYRRRLELTPKVEEEYKILLAERNNTQAKYDDLMRKSMEAKVSQGMEKGQMGERFTIIDPARLPEKPVSPNIPAFLLIGLILGIGAGVGVASVMEFSDQSVRSIRGLSRATGLPVLGEIPVIVTRGDLEKARNRKILWFAGIFVVVISGVVIFHLFIMDLDIFWAKIMRVIDRYAVF